MPGLRGKQGNQRNEMNQVWLKTSKSCCLKRSRRWRLQRSEGVSGATNHYLTIATTLRSALSAGKNLSPPSWRHINSYDWSCNLVPPFLLLYPFIQFVRKFRNIPKQVTSSRFETRFGTFRNGCQSRGNYPIRMSAFSNFTKVRRHSSLLLSSIYRRSIEFERCRGSTLGRDWFCHRPILGA